MEMAGTPAAQDFVQLLLLKRALQNEVVFHHCVITILQEGQSE
jgi:hypothetical protein